MKVLLRAGLSGIAAFAIVLSISLPGCGSDSGSTTAPNGEVKIVPPKDASGKEMPIEGEAPLKTTPK